MGFQDCRFLLRSVFQITIVGICSKVINNMLPYSGNLN